MIPVFDGHNDILLHLTQAGAERAALWPGPRTGGHLDLPRMRQGGFAGGFFAIYVPSPKGQEAVDYMAAMQNPPYALPLPQPVAQAEAQAMALAQAGLLLWMERASDGAFRLCRTAGEVRRALSDGVIAGVMHMEGAEAIDADLDALHAFHAMGLRSLGPVWSRPTIFGHGVPFAFPASPDTGPGLTEAGKRLVRECNKLKIMLDVSHLNEAGFNDLARLSDAPIVATHSNAHAVCASSRNLTDRQLDIIRDSGGMVGLNYAVSFLNPDGRRNAACGWGPVLAHLDHLLERLGEGHVGLGSDFDGAEIPEVMGDVAGLPGLIAAMRAHGYDDALITRIAHGNWLDLMDRTFGG